MRFKNQTLNFLICAQIRQSVISVRNSLSAQPLYCLNSNMKTEGSGKGWFGFCAHQSHPSWRLTGLCRPGTQLLLRICPHKQVTVIWNAKQSGITKKDPKCPCRCSNKQSTSGSKHSKTFFHKVLLF